MVTCERVIPDFTDRGLARFKVWGSEYTKLFVWIRGSHLLSRELGLLVASYRKATEMWTIKRICWQGTGEPPRASARFKQPPLGKTRISAAPEIPVTGTKDLKAISSPSVFPVLSASHCCRQCFLHFVEQWGHGFRVIYLFITYCSSFDNPLSNVSDWPSLSGGPMFSLPKPWRQDHTASFGPYARVGGGTEQSVLWEAEYQSIKGSKTDYWGDPCKPCDHNS